MVVLSTTTQLVVHVPEGASYGDTLLVYCRHIDKITPAKVPIGCDPTFSVKCSFTYDSETLATHTLEQIKARAAIISSVIIADRPFSPYTERECSMILGRYNNLPRKDDPALHGVVLDTLMAADTTRKVHMYNKGGRVTPTAERQQKALFKTIDDAMQRQRSKCLVGVPRQFSTPMPPNAMSLEIPPVLDGAQPWRAGLDGEGFTKNNWLEMDTGQMFVLRGVILQGWEDQRITACLVHVGRTTGAADDSTPMENADGTADTPCVFELKCKYNAKYGMTHLQFKHAVVGRFIRITPLSYEGRPSLRAGFSFSPLHTFAAAILETQARFGLLAAKKFVVDAETAAGSSRAYADAANAAATLMPSCIHKTNADFAQRDAVDEEMAVRKKRMLVEQMEKYCKQDKADEASHMVLSSTSTVRLSMIAGLHEIAWSEQQWSWCTEWDETRYSSFKAFDDDKYAEYSARCRRVFTWLFDKDRELKSALYEMAIQQVGSARWLKHCGDSAAKEVSAFVTRHMGILREEFVPMTSALIVDNTELWDILMNWDLTQNRRMFHKQRVNAGGLVFPCVCKAWRRRLPLWIQAAVTMDQAAAAAAGAHEPAGGADQRAAGP